MMVAARSGGRTVGWSIEADWCCSLEVVVGGWSKVIDEQ